MIHWIDDTNAVIDDTLFVFAADPPDWFAPARAAAGKEHIFVFKTKMMLTPYLELFESFPSANVVELGIFGGGSVAFNALVGKPSKLVAIDIIDGPVEALSTVITSHGLGAVVFPHYGVDQADRIAVAAAVSSEFGDAPLDLILDDASHLYGPTLASFEVLFPRLRPGGRYVIEDWASEHYDANLMFSAIVGTHDGLAEALAEKVVAALTSDDPTSRRRIEDLWSMAMARPGSRMHSAMWEWFETVTNNPASATAQVLVDQLLPLRDRAIQNAPTSAVTNAEPPMMRLAIELVFASTWAPGAIADVTFTDQWIHITRGPAELDPGDFRLDGMYTDYFGVVGDWPTEPAQIDPTLRPPVGH